jgi:DNA-binding NarL/FixJ family response regulator
MAQLDNATPQAYQVSAVRLVLAETYPLLLDGMTRVLSSEPGFHVLARCATAEEVIRAVERHHPDVLVLDLEIAGNAMMVLQTLRAQGMATHVVLLAGKLTEHEFIDAIRVGARGVLLKSMAPHLLIKCIRKVHSGDVWFEKESMSRAFERILQHEAGYQSVANVLTPREIEVVRLVAAGRTTKQIADTLCVTTGTIKVHTHHIYEKLGVKSRLELTLYARDRGLLSPLLQSRIGRTQ